MPKHVHSRKKRFVAFTPIKGALPTKRVQDKFDREIEILIAFFGNRLFQRAVAEAYPEQAKYRYFDLKWAENFNGAGSQFHHFVRLKTIRDYEESVDTEGNVVEVEADMRIDSTIQSPFSTDRGHVRDLSMLRDTKRNLNFNTEWYDRQQSKLDMSARPQTTPICTQTAKLDMNDNLCQSYALHNFIRPMERLVEVEDEDTNVITNPQEKLLRLSNTWLDVLNNPTWRAAMQKYWPILLNKAKNENDYFEAMTTLELYAEAQQRGPEEPEPSEETHYFATNEKGERVLANDLRLYRDPWNQYDPSFYNVRVGGKKVRYAMTGEKFIKMCLQLVQLFRNWGYRRFIGQGNYNQTHYAERTAHDANNRRTALPEYRAQK